MYTSAKWPLNAKVNQDKLTPKPLLQLIEDDPDTRLYMTDAFMDTYRIIDSPDGITGYQQAVSERPDIIISDVTMPGMDGIALCTKLKNDTRTNYIPVVLLTGRSAEAQTLEGLACGADDYMPKPFSLSILKAKIRNLIKSREVLRQCFAVQPVVSGPVYPSTVSDEKFLRKACEIVEQNLSNPDFEANDFAVAVGMSRAQLYRKLHSLSGQTVKEFVRVIRLKKAVAMISSAEHNISQAAFEVGFSSVAYFTRAFKDHFGQCPTKYMTRKSAQD